MPSINNWLMLHYKSSQRCQAITHSHLLYINMCLIINRAYHIDNYTMPKDTSSSSHMDTWMIQLIDQLNAQKIVQQVPHAERTYHEGIKCTISSSRRVNLPWRYNIINTIQ